MTDTDVDNPVVYISLNEFLALAARVLGTDAASVRRQTELGMADSALHAPQAGFGDTEFYPTLAEKAAVLCWHLAKNHALPDGNKRTAFTAMVVFLRRNKVRWHKPSDDDAVDTVVAVAAGQMSVEELTVWVRTHIDQP